MMGGSGGGFFHGDADPVDQAQKIRNAEKEVQDSRFETNVNDLLSSELATFNDRNTEDINSILQTIEKDLGDQVEGAVDLLFGGSISKHTYVDGFSDVDALILFDQTDLANKNPSDLRKLLAQTLKERYDENKIWVGPMAVTLELKGHSIQLLPALRVGDSFKISNSDGKDWSQIRPKKFAEALTIANQSQSGKVVPSIKLAKAIINQLPPKQQLSGYHTESLAIKVFKSYEGPKTLKAMLTHFFEQSATIVKKPIKDSTGQSVHVDGYLGTENSTQRRIVSMALERISRRIRNADGMCSVEQWGKILGVE